MSETYSKGFVRRVVKWFDGSDEGAFPNWLRDERKGLVRAGLIEFIGHDPDRGMDCYRPTDFAREVSQ